MWSHLWSRLADRMTTSRAASGGIVLSAGTARDGSLCREAKRQHRRQSFALRASHRRGSGYCWRAARRCHTLPKLACTTNLLSEPSGHPTLDSGHCGFGDSGKGAAAGYFRCDDRPVCRYPSPSRLWRLRHFPQHDFAGGNPYLAFSRRPGRYLQPRDPLQRAHAAISRLTRISFCLINCAGAVLFRAAIVRR